MNEVKEQLADLKLKLVDAGRNVFHEKVLSLAPALILHVESGLIVFATPGVCGMFNYLVNELEGLPIENLIPAAFKEKHRGHLVNYKNDPKQRNMGQHGMSLMGVKKHGAEFSVKIALYPFVEDKTLFVLAFVFEI